MRWASVFTCVVVLTGTLATSAAAAVINTLASFSGANGEHPYSGLIADASGNFYGTAAGGGSSGNNGNGWGTVFKLAALAAFDNINGANPRAGLIADASGNFYGTTNGNGSSSHGTVFKLAAGTNALTALATFNNTNGASPYGGLIADASGNLYGTTYIGGSNPNGTVFKVAAGTNALSTLVQFTGPNGANPYCTLIADASGNHYGTTYQGGSFSSGTIFKVAAGTNVLTTLAAFTNGANPYAGPLADASGNFYGTTWHGGPSGDGTVFELAAGSNTITTLATFDGTNGAFPLAGLIADALGNLYGTTIEGGPTDSGTIFKIDAVTHNFTTLATFDDTYPDPAEPYGTLIADASGNLYGTTAYGGSNGYGTVFELTDTGFVVPEPAGFSVLALGTALTLLCRRPK